MRYYARSTSADLVEGFINFFVGLAELILGLRVLFRLFNANPTSTFVHWIYATSATLMAPFRGIFPSLVLDRGFVIDFSALFAMLVYALIGYLLIVLVSSLAGERTEGVKKR